MKRGLPAIVAFMCICFAASAWADDRTGSTVTVAIQQAIDRSVGNQPLIRKAEAAVAAARAKVGEARSAYFPSVNGSASYTRVGPDQTITLPGQGSFSLAPVDNYGFKLSVNQLLFQLGSRGAQVAMASTGVDLATIGLEQVRSSLAYQTVQTFYGALLTSEEIAVLDAQLKDVNEHLAVVRKKEQTGSATHYDVLSTQVRLAATQSRRTDTESQYRKALIALHRLLGIDPSVRIELSGNIERAAAAGSGSTTLGSDLSSLVERALKERPEMRRSATEERTAELRQHLASTAWSPTLSAHGSFGFNNGFLPDSDKLTANWSAGLTLNVPIFNGLANARRLDEADANLAASRAQVEAEREDIASQVREASEDLAAQKIQVEMSLAQLDQAQQMLDVARVQYDLGVITNVEYLDSETALVQAQLSHLQTLYRELMSRYSLAQAVGAPIWSTGTEQGRR